MSDNGVGVFGEGPGHGVHGKSSGGSAVRGDNTAKGDGVRGVSADGNRVLGESTSGNGVYGYSANGNGVYGSSGGAFGKAGYSESSSVLANSRSLSPSQDAAGISRC